MIDTKNRTMLVDGDLLAFMCSVSMEEAIKWDDDIWTLHASESKSIDNLANTIDSYQQMLLCDNVVIALSIIQIMVQSVHVLLLPILQVYMPSFCPCSSLLNLIPHLYCNF